MTATRSRSASPDHSAIPTIQALVSTSASHELVEMLVDPGINLLATGPDAKAAYAYETADPVEQYAFSIDRIPMSNFVYPSYFETFRAPGSVPFDHLRVVNSARREC